MDLGKSLQERPRMRRIILISSILGLILVGWIMFRQSPSQVPESLSILVRPADGDRQVERVHLAAEADEGGFLHEAVPRGTAAPVKLLDVLDAHRLLVQTVRGVEVTQLLGVGGPHARLGEDLNSWLEESATPELRSYLASARLDELPPEGVGGSRLDLRNVAGERLVWLEKEGLFLGRTALSVHAVQAGWSYPVGAWMPADGGLVLDPARWFDVPIEPQGIFARVEAHELRRQRALLLLGPAPMPEEQLQRRVRHVADRLALDLAGDWTEVPVFRWRGSAAVDPAHTQHAQLGLASWIERPDRAPPFLLEKVLHAHASVAWTADGGGFAMHYAADWSFDDLELEIAHALVHHWQRKERPLWIAVSPTAWDGHPARLPLLEAHAEAAAVRAWRGDDPERAGFSGRSLSPWAWMLEQIAAARGASLEETVDALVEEPGAFAALAYGRVDLGAFLHRRGWGPWADTLRFEGRVADDADRSLILRVHWTGTEPFRAWFSGRFDVVFDPEAAPWPVETPPFSITMMPGSRVDLLLAPYAGTEDSVVNRVHPDFSPTAMLPKEVAADPDLADLLGRTADWLHR